MVIPNKLNGKKGNCSIPSKLTTDDFVSEEYVPGSLVWAKHSSYPWWPAMVEDDPDEEEYYRQDTEGDEEYHVVFITDKPEKVRRAWIAAKHLTAYVKQPEKNFIKKSLQAGFKLSKNLADTALPMSLPERLKKFSFANLSNLKFPAVKKEIKVPKIPVKKNGKDRPVYAIANKRRRHRSAAEGTSNGIAAIVPIKVKDATGDSAITVPEIGHKVEKTTSISEVDHTIEISADPHPPQTAAVNAATSEIVTGDQTSNLSPTTDSDKQLNSLNDGGEEVKFVYPDMAAFEAELDLYSEEEFPPSSPECDKKPLPEFLLNREIDELFSDVMSDSEDDETPHLMVLESDREPNPGGTSAEEPITEKFVLTSEEDIWDINTKYKAIRYIPRFSH